MALVPETCLEVASLDLVSDEILLHSLQHVQVGALRHSLLVRLVAGLGQTGLQLRQALLVVRNGTLDLSLLQVKAGDLLADAVVLELLESDLLLGLVVLLLDLGKLD